MWQTELQTNIRQTLEELNTEVCILLLNRNVHYVKDPLITIFVWMSSSCKFCLVNVAGWPYFGFDFKFYRCYYFSFVCNSYFSWYQGRYRQHVKEYLVKFSFWLCKSIQIRWGGTSGPPLHRQGIQERSTVRVKKSRIT